MFVAWTLHTPADTEVPGWKSWDVLPGVRSDVERVFNRSHSLAEMSGLTRASMSGPRWGGCIGSQCLSARAFASAVQRYVWSVKGRLTTVVDQSKVTTGTRGDLVEFAHDCGTVCRVDKKYFA